MPHENGHFTWGNDLGAATMTFSWVHHDIVMVCDHGGTRDILLGFFPIVGCVLSIFASDLTAKVPQLCSVVSLC